MRFWSVLILATRPFLLCFALKRNELNDDEKKTYFDELSHACIEAAEKSFAIIKDMQEDDSLSSRLPLDFNYILELNQVFLISNAFNGDPKYIDHVKGLLQVLQSMDRAGWNEKALPEVETQLREHGLLETTWESSINIPDFDFLMGNGELSFDNYEQYVKGRI